MSALAARRRVAVVGGGWAGLTAAVRAASEGHHVTVFEASRQWGGRARSVPLTLPDGRTLVLDNGQHILIGAYTDTLRLMRTVGVDTDAALLRTPLALVYPDGTGLKLPDWGMHTAHGAQPALHGLATRLSRLLALPVLVGVWKAGGWPWRDKLALLATATRWQLAGFTCDANMTVAQLCAGLPATLLAGFIDPLCVSALNTPADQASGQVFLRVLKDALFGLPGGADLLLPRVDLGTLFPQAAVSWLTAPERGASLRLGTRVTDLRPNPPPPGTTVGGGTAQGPHPPPVPHAGQWGWCVNGEPFDCVVLANSASKQASALVDIGLLATYSICDAQPAIGRTSAPDGVTAGDWLRATHQLRFEAIATVYAWCVQPGDGVSGTGVTGHVLPRPMTALRHGPGQPAQFVFDRSWLNGPKGLLAFVVSASQADAHSLETQVCAQAQAQLGLAISPLKTIVEKRATFACTPGLRRPHAHIGPNLIAAGDHIEGPYPATLEGAVRSGWYAGGQAAA